MTKSYSINSHFPLFMTFLLLFISCSSSPKPIIPSLPTAHDQFLYAYEKKQLLKLKKLDDKTMYQERNKIIPFYQKVIDQFPQDKQYTPLAYLGIGDLYYQIGKHKQAILTFNQITEKYPDIDFAMSGALLGKGKALEAIQNKEDAALAYQQCLDLFESNTKDDVKNFCKQCKQKLARLQNEK